MAGWVEEMSDPVLPAASLPEVIAYLQARFAEGAVRVALEVLDPDLGAGRYAGERIEHAGAVWVHRPFRVWVDLAERLGLRLLTPHAIKPPRIELVFERLDPGARLRADAEDATEKYGAASPFARVSKLEDPGFVVDLAEALARAQLPADARILDLGINTGDELALIHAVAPGLARAHFVGVDHSASAVAIARARFPDAELHVADLNGLPALGLGRFDLVLSIGTLHSPGIDDRELLRRLVQDHLAPRGAVIVGFPNCRYVDGEVEWGTRVKNLRQPELGVLVKDVAFYRKYLQQHDRQVYVTGKNYVLVTGVAR